jgi:bifunctional non-homologous end joining protein LigD
MRKLAFESCIPTRGTKVPAGPDWIHEIKHDGYRLIVVRDGARVRLFTRNGYDCSNRYPLIVEAALRNRTTSFVIDGEAVLLGVDGISDFNGLHSRKHDDEVQLYAFDILALEGEDLRKLPLHLRKTNLARLLAQRPEGIFVSDFEQGEIGPDLFRAACKLGLEAWCPSAAIGPTAPADPRIGSRSRTEAIHRWKGSRRPSHERQQRGLRSLVGVGRQAAQ